MAQLDKDHTIEGWQRITPGSDLPLPREPQPPVIDGSSPLDPDIHRMLGWTADVKIFDLSDEESLIKYRDLLNTVGCSPFSRVSHIERRWVDASQNWKVLVEVENQVRVGVPIKDR